MAICLLFLPDFFTGFEFFIKNHMITESRGGDGDELPGFWLGR